MLGLIGIACVASALRLVALPRTPCLLSHGHTVLGEGVSLQSGLGGAAIVLGKLLLLSQVKLSPPPQPLLQLHLRQHQPRSSVRGARDQSALGLPEGHK